MRDNNWERLLAYVTGLVNQRLLLQNEYLIAENRILRSHLPSRLRLSDPERSTLAEIGKRLGRKELQPPRLGLRLGDEEALACCDGARQAVDEFRSCHRVVQYMTFLPLSPDWA